MVYRTTKKNTFKEARLPKRNRFIDATKDVTEKDRVYAKWYNLKAQDAPLHEIDSEIRRLESKSYAYAALMMLGLLTVASMVIAFFLIMTNHIL